ncbi:unnamed protein product [Staurois parvus]|uniref:Secreted protein n=1 Tax=Staurois parvus TaxID=386267 RepID=A0ABN9DEU3_9NEOB|nr:unnamed protein product [Staurois parvus]
MRMQNPRLSVWTALIGPVLITCTLPRKKTSLAIHTKLSKCMCLRVQSVLSGDKTWTYEQKEGQRNRIRRPFYTMRRITP